MDLIDRVARVLGITAEEAEGCIGAVLALAQARLDPHELTQVADAIPGFSDLVARSPIFDPDGRPWRALFFRFLGSAGGLRPLATPLRALGLPRSLAAGAAAIVIDYVSQQAGSEAEAALRSALR